MKIQAVTLQSPSEWLQQILAIEAMSFAAPLGVVSLQADLQNPHAWIYAGVEETSQIIVAYVIVHQLYDEMHVMQMATHPSFRKQGFGYLLMDRVVQQANQIGSAKILLEVRKSNHPAISLYKHQQFVVLAERKKYYSDNNEDAWVMERDLRTTKEAIS